MHDHTNETPAAKGTRMCTGTMEKLIACIGTHSFQHCRRTGSGAYVGGMGAVQVGLCVCAHAREGAAHIDHVGRHILLVALETLVRRRCVKLPVHHDWTL